MGVCVCEVLGKYFIDFFDTDISLESVVKTVL